MKKIFPFLYILMISSVLLANNIENGKNIATPSVQVFATSNGVTVDTNIKYFNTATKGLDPGFDLGNFAGASFDLFTRLLEGGTGQNFTIQSLPTSDYENMVISLGIKAQLGDEVVFSAKALNLPTGVDVFIEDKEANIYVNINEVSKYTAKMSENVNGIGRFYLHTKLSGSITETIVWNGNQNTSWSVGANWSSTEIPLATDNVFIPNVINTPLIESGTATEIKSLKIFSSLSISEGGSIVVNENLDTNGTIDMHATNNKSSVLLVKGTSNGQITYERGGLLANKWSVVSAPVEGQSIKEFVENPVNNIRKNTTITPNRYAIGYYDDTRAIGVKWMYYTTTDLATNSILFEKGKSYAISRETDGSVFFTGSLTTESVPKAIEASRWNAIGNPYTTFLPINGNSGSNFITENVDNLEPGNVGIYVWDNAQNKYAAHSLASLEYSLAPGQGFFIKAKIGKTDIIFNESKRTVQSALGTIFGKGIKQKIVPSIQLLATMNGITVDTKIKYIENTTKGLDVGYDLENFEAENFDVYTKLLNSKNNKNFTIQSLPNSEYQNMVIPVGIKAKQGSEITFSLKSFHLPETINVFIEDKKTNIVRQLDETDGVYKVKLSESLNSSGRFYLHTKQLKLPIESNTLADIKIYTIDKKNLRVEGVNKEQVNLYLYNILGREVFKTSFEGKEKNDIILSNINKGIYVVKVKMAKGILTEKLLIK